MRPPITPEQEIECRTDFEAAMLFNPFQLASPGCLQKGPDGLYLNPFIESAWRGYKIAIDKAYEITERCDPMRYIGPVMVAEFQQVSNYEWNGSDDSIAEIHDNIRAALTVARKFPT